MGFITKESMEYDAYKREHQNETFEEFDYRFRMKIWRLDIPDPGNFDDLDTYHEEMRLWYHNKPKKVTK